MGTQSGAGGAANALAGAARKGARALVGPQSPLRRSLGEPGRERLRAARRVLPSGLVTRIERVTGTKSGPGVSKSLLAGAAKRPDVPTTPIRLYVGPANFAGQGWLWGHSLERHVEGVGAVSMVVRGPLRFRSSYEVDPDVYRHIAWQRAQQEYIAQFTHVLIEAERPLLGTLYGRTVEREIELYQGRGQRVGLISHGTDVRIPSVHAATYPHSPFTDPDDPTTARLEERAQANVALLRRFAADGGPVFASTPDLLDYVPEARWCPGVVDINLWASDWPVMARRRPRVVHVPSNGRLKGSERIDPILTALHDEGLIDYRSLRGLDSGEVRATYQEADIVLDQFVLGLYGVAAVEAMAAGRVVVAFVGDAVRDRVREATGEQIPIVEATPETIEQVIRGLVADRDEARAIAARGTAYAKKIHDGRYSAQVLNELARGELKAPETVPPLRRPLVGPKRPAPDADAAVRLFVGPANFAGQGDLWAKAAQEHLDGVSARSMGLIRHKVFTFATDYAIDPHPYNRVNAWGERQERLLSDLYTHVLIEACRPITGFRPVERSAHEIETLRAAGVKLAHIAHGTDIRIPSVHLGTTPWSPYDDPTWDLVPTYEKNARANVEMLTEFAGPVFVSTPDLLDFLPDATWCPVIVDAARWASDAPVLEREVPVVAHAPSSARTKGSDLIDPVLAAMDAEGLISYRRVQDTAPADMPGVYGDADIVLDQFVLGSYGVAACEAMAAGRVVVGHNTDAVRARVREATGLDMPIVEANPDTLREVLLGLFADRDGARATAEAGRRFVAQVHDGRRSAQALADFLAS